MNYWKRKFSVLLLLLFISKNSIAQEENLELKNDCASSFANFTKVVVIDKRLINQSFGYVQKGAFDKVFPVVYKGNIKEGITNFFLAKDTIGLHEKDLAIIIDEIYLSENVSGLSETGRLKLSLRFFAKNNNEKYFELMNVDKAYTVSALDVTHKLLRSVNEQLCDISEKLCNLPFVDSEKNQEFSLAELTKIDSIEKLKIPIYRDPIIKTGVFFNFEQFKANSPENCLVSIEINKRFGYKVSIKKNAKGNFRG